MGVSGQLHPPAALCPGNSLLISTGQETGCSWSSSRCGGGINLYIFFLQVTTVDSTDFERTVPDQTPHCSTPEVIDLVGNENYNYNDCGESLLEASGGTSRVPRSQYKQQSVPASSRDINILSSAETSDDHTKRVLAAVENLYGQVEMLRKYMVLMEERLTLIEDKTKDIVSKH
jgi:hypothetical protein